MNRVLIILLLITVCGGYFRFFALDKNPTELTVDEVSIGYNAYSILKTGKDEYGKNFPLTFESLGDYKPPLYIYSVAPSIALFGLNEFAVRFPSVAVGTLTIPFFYIFLNLFLRNKKYSLIGMLLLAISPWHIYLSRFGYEAEVAASLMLIGIYCLIRSVRGYYLWSFGASVFLLLSMYTYHSERLFVPLFTLLFLIMNFREFSSKRNLLLFVSTAAILGLPLILAFLFGQDRTRAQMTIITNDIDLQRYVLVKAKMGWNQLNIFGSDFFLTFFYMIRKFFAYIQPSFMFYKSLEMTREGVYGIGVVYLFEAVFLFFGTIKLIKERFENKYLIIPWLILGLMPGAITLGEPQPRRTLVIWPMITMISAVGAVSLFSFLYSMKNKVLKFSIVSGLSLLILVNLLQFLLIYSVHFPKQRGDGLMEGSREAAQYILKNQDKYRTIIYDPVRGVEGPFLVNVPHLYILFYSKYDPRQYHSLEKQHGENSFTFDKYTIRVIDWPKDANLKDTLFIGSPWSIPEKNLKKEEILHKIYLSNGKLALLIVSPRNKE